jgi:tRNA pseudouridine32 synthase/23S rRNA pseudouridine746 synthase
MEILGRSVVYLPEGSPPFPRLLDFLTARFPKVAPAVWEARLRDGKITGEDGRPVSLDTPYRPATRLFYYRESADEPVVCGREEILYLDDQLLVADKPHFLPVTPTGPYVRETLLYRLRERTGNLQLSPLHRLDRQTAGLVLFSTNAATRGALQTLFMTGEIAKTYQAICHWRPGADGTTWLVENRIEKGEPWFRMRVVPGQVNARTRIVLQETCGDCARVALFPETGKKHQLRLHLAGLGLPIIGDRWYPDLLAKAADDPARPLHLLATRLRFRHPLSGQDLDFTCARSLAFPA